MDERVFLQDLFRTALKAADPCRLTLEALEKRAFPKERITIAGAGKAAAEMARAAADYFGDLASGLVIVPYGHGCETHRISVVEAAHPVPDKAGQKAAQEILALARSLGGKDHLLCLLSGGGSALLSLPAAGITFTEKQRINRVLLKSGAPIAAINTVRKHLSAIKGGRLAAAAYPAKVTTLVISDVPGDDPSVIASGPTVADVTTRQEALAILQHYGIDIAGDILSETPKPDDPRLAGISVTIVANAATALNAAAAKAQTRGIKAVMLGGNLEGEARRLARAHAAAIRQHPDGPLLLLSGGEGTVKVTGSGQGGRNTEFLLALALELRGKAGIFALAADTDGIDGTSDAAGAVITPDTLIRAQKLGLDAASMLADNDSYRFFKALDDLIITGPTRTNVNDFRAIFVRSC